MKLIVTVVFGYCILQVSHALAQPRAIFTLDENYVCNIKKSCLDCLRLPHCSWCQSENKCFSPKLKGFEDFCKDNNTEVKDYGLSLEDNAQCACTGDEIERNCYPPGVTEGPECSDRGECLCGRCICTTYPDPEHPTKIVMGDFCEFDNFSCDGPKCNEGPYSLNQLRNEADNLDAEDI